MGNTEEHFETHEGNAISKIWTVGTSIGQMTQFPQQVNCMEKKRDTRGTSELKEIQETY